MAISYYESPTSDFLSESPESILGKLTRHHHHELEHNQRNAWLKQTDILKEQLATFRNGHIFFELLIPRMGKRVDCVVILFGVVFVLEFKVGATGFDRCAIDQVHDYALDLKNFHQGSHFAKIVPVLVATNAKDTGSEVIFAADRVATPLLAGPHSISQILSNANELTDGASVDIDTWRTSGYRPTPTIIEAAQALYQNHNAEEIARSDAGAKNLHATSHRISEIIDYSKRAKRKSICFVTGVPGAGKTLAGLNIAALRAQNHKDENAVFLSGNGPLVTVLREALARDQKLRQVISKSDASRQVRSFVQNIHHFRDEYLRDLSAPFEKVVVFDEGQRAWNREQTSKFMQNKRGQEGFSLSEPEFLLGVMDRHKDWCTVISLIGGGQEINTGEAGILEWLNALKSKYPAWDVHTSNLLDDPHYTVDPKAVDLLRETRGSSHSDLHLAVSMRSFRAETLSSFVSVVLDGNASEASHLMENLLPRYPIYLTRDLKVARSWLRSVARGNERIGLVASSRARRLRPEGIHIKASIDPASWFLNDKDDVRSSYYLEDVATEFDIQGLELDWVGICWDADLRRVDGDWRCFSFRGSRWQSVNANRRQIYLLNAYRVLLTRARQGMVIFMPRGNEDDATRPPRYYDDTYQFLRDCGIPALELR
jgi:schlafen family protein